METSLASIVHDWHDFYGLVGTAAATLVGLMFVAASIGAGVFEKQHEEGMQAFISPTVVHFAVALFICILITIPSQTWLTLGSLIECAGLVGLMYSVRTCARIYRTLGSKLDRIDRLFYALIPVMGYLLVVAAATALLAHAPWSSELMAAGLIVLMLAGIRNAWDMTIWIVMRRNNP